MNKCYGNVLSAKECLQKEQKKTVELGTLSQHGWGDRLSRLNNFDIYLRFEGLGVGR